MAKTRDEKLRDSGILFFDFDGVLARTTDARKMSASETLRSLKIAGMGAIVLLHIRERFTRHRRSAAGNTLNYGRRWSIYISQNYADQIGTTRRYYNRRGWFAGKFQRGIFHASSGMWQGAQARSSMRGREVVLDFRDQSVGQHGVKAHQRTIKGGKRAGQTVNVRANTNVKNSVKAGSVFRTFRVNVLQPSFSEELAMADAVSNRIGIPMAAAFGADEVRVRAVGAGDGLLYTRLARYWKTSD